jgi:hypothetical protein
MTRSSSMRLIALPLTCGLLLSACGTTTIDQSSETSLARKGLTAAHVGAAKSVKCPSGVAAKVGKTFDCHITLVNGHEVTFTIKVDKISGSSGHLTIVGAKES